MSLWNLVQCQRTIKARGLWSRLFILGGLFLQQLYGVMRTNYPNQSWVCAIRAGAPLYDDYLSCTLWSPTFQSVVGHFRLLAYYLANPTRSWTLRWRTDAVRLYLRPIQTLNAAFLLFFSQPGLRSSKESQCGGLKADEGDQRGGYRSVWDMKKLE